MLSDDYINENDSWLLMIMRYVLKVYCFPTFECLKLRKCAKCWEMC